MGLLSHLQHAHPALKPITLERKLRGFAVLSPWVTFNQSAVSMTTNKYSDALPTKSLKLWSEAFMGRASVDEYNNPLTAPSDWWKNCMVERVLILAGREELFVDDIEAFAEKFKVRELARNCLLPGRVSTCSSFMRSVERT